MIKNIIYFCTCMCLLSCNLIVLDDDNIAFSHSMFESVDLPKSRIKKVSPDSMYLKKPYLIKYIGHNIVAIGDNYSEKLICFLNTETGEYKKCVKKGDGPNQVLRIENLWTMSDTLFFAGPQDSKIGYCTIPTNGHLPEVKTFPRLKESFIRAEVLDTENIITIPFSKGIRIKKINKLSGVSDSITIFPSVPKTSNYEPDNTMFQPFISISPNKKHIALANMTWNIIELYDSDLDNRIIIKGPDSINSYVKKATMGGFKFFQQGNPWICFRGVSSSNKIFMVGYIGSPFDNSNDSILNIKSILSFTWDGVPLKEYILEEALDSFDIDFSTMTLYGIVNSPEPHIIKYQLEDSIA